MTKPLCAPDFPMETARLSFRTFQDDDLPFFTAVRQNKELMHYLPFGEEGPEDMAAAANRRKGLTCIEAPGDAITCIMVEKESGAAVGEVMLRYPANTFMTGEVGFLLLAEHQGKGYATEGATEMMRLGFEVAGFHRIIGICDAANAASRATLARLGMRMEAHHRSADYFKGAWHDQNVFAILQDEWRAANGG